MNKISYLRYLCIWYLLYLIGPCLPQICVKIDWLRSPRTASGLQQHHEEQSPVLPQQALDRARGPQERPRAAAGGGGVAMEDLGTLVTIDCCSSTRRPAARCWWRPGPRWTWWRPRRTCTGRGVQVYRCTVYYPWTCTASPSSCTRSSPGPGSGAARSDQTWVGLPLYLLIYIYLNLFKF